MSVANKYFYNISVYEKIKLILKKEYSWLDFFSRIGSNNMGGYFKLEGWYQ